MILLFKFETNNPFSSFIHLSLAVIMIITQQITLNYLNDTIRLQIHIYIFTKYLITDSLRGYYCAKL